MVLLPREAQHADVRLSVIILAQTYAHRSAPAIGSVAIRAHEQWNVIVLACIDRGKRDFDKGIERRGLARREIRPSFKTQPVISCGHFSRLEKSREPAVHAGDSARNFFPFRSAGLQQQRYSDTLRGTADGNIQNV